MTSTLSLLDVLFNAVRKGNLPSKLLVNHNGTNVLALITASPGTYKLYALILTHSLTIHLVLFQYKKTLCAGIRSKRFVAPCMGYNSLTIDDSVVCDIFLRTVDIFTAVIKVLLLSLMYSAITN